MGSPILMYQYGQNPSENKRFSVNGSLLCLRAQHYIFAQQCFADVL